VVEFHIENCKSTVLNVLKHVRNGDIDYNFDLQKSFETVAGCKILKKYSVQESITERSGFIPRYWCKLQFDTKEEFTLFLLKWS
jgi:hypothetical protein